MDVEGQWVHFEIRDAYYPDPKEILVDLFGDRLLQGKVIGVTDSGQERSRYAVVEVEGFPQGVIVPMDRIWPSLLGDDVDATE